MNKKTKTILMKYSFYGLIFSLSGCVATPEVPSRYEIARLAEEQQKAEELERYNEAQVWVKSLPEENADYGPYPKEYKSIIEKYLSRILKDPDSVKISKISKPRKEHEIDNQFTKSATYGYSTCVWLNAKNSYGGYTGEKVYWFLIRNNYVSSYDTGLSPIYIGRSKNCEDGE